ncbi:hypothetical protein [Thioclava pacifica]|uniref:DUF4148 domain-containing protein n=1 Tax=Thioclava pacifica DSM 10166 TaxID=1353537 RepID=A0A074JB92_9RHOB|nr:hypothetical protein [Thioclava pacifica]KEO52853.1 hypothetical protein TP2_07900 [Thioclava pacifica DSM 10166]
MKTIISTAIAALALSTTFAAAGGNGYGSIAPSMAKSYSSSTGSSVGEVTPGKAQLAAQLGLDAAKYTSAELTRIQSALYNNDVDTANFVISHENRKPVDVAPQPVMGRDS